MTEKQPVAFTIYRPENQAKAVVQIVHGMMDHRRRYDYFAKALCEAGFGVITYDQRGHGETAASPEELGYFAGERGWKLLISDCLSINELAQKEFPGVPVILFGHSMGSLVSRSFIKRYDSKVQGVVLCGAPCYNKMARMGEKLAGVLSRIRGPKGRSKMLKEIVLGQFNRKVPNAKTDCDWVSRNEENVERYLADPLCQFNFTNRAYEDLMFGMQDMHDTMRWNLQNPTLPILFIVGSDDPCTGGEKGLKDSVKTLREAGYEYIDQHVYAGLRHELLNEKERDQIIADVISWIETLVLKKAAD